jgi:hypothetical protein
MLLTGFVLVLAACADDTAATTTVATTLPVATTTTLPVETTTSTTTTTLPPGGPPLIAEGDRNETVAAFQWLLVCGGHGTLTPDGNFGPTTGAVLTSALTASASAVPDGRLCRPVTELRRRSTRHLDGDTLIVLATRPAIPRSTRSRSSSTLR